MKEMLKSLDRAPWSKILDDGKISGLESILNDLKKGKVSPYVLPGIYIAKSVTPETIISLVSSYLRLPENEIMKKSRKRNVVYARALCYYLLKKFKVSSCETLKSIGIVFNKDHSTVLYSLEEIKNLAEVYPEVKKDIENLTALTKEIFSRVMGTSYVE